MSSDPLSLAFGALADPTRRAILARLAAGGETTVAQLAEPFASVSAGVIAVPSTVIETVPLGTVLPEAEATAIANVTLAPTTGAVVDAAIVVVVAIKVDVDAGQAPTRLPRSSDPSPVTWS